MTRTRNPLRRPSIIRSPSRMPTTAPIEFGMRSPRVIAVQPGSFVGWMQARGKAGGQNKVPRVISDQALFAALLAFMGERGHVLARSEGDPR